MSRFNNDLDTAWCAAQMLHAAVQLQAAGSPEADGAVTAALAYYAYAAQRLER